MISVDCPASHKLKLTSWSASFDHWCAGHSAALKRLEFSVEEDQIDPLDVLLLAFTFDITGQTSPRTKVQSRPFRNILLCFTKRRMAPLTWLDVRELALETGCLGPVGFGDAV
jgi:hypothetical protein